MRELGFNVMWPKLAKTRFTTFRFPRRDKRDWQEGETVRIVYKARTKQREILGTAVILTSQAMTLRDITDKEAVADGFHSGKEEMYRWLMRAHGVWKIRFALVGNDIVNKLTLAWMADDIKVATLSCEG